MRRAGSGRGFGQLASAFASSFKRSCKSGLRRHVVKMKNNRRPIEEIAESKVRYSAIQVSSLSALAEIS